MRAKCGKFHVCLIGEVIEDRIIVARRPNFMVDGLSQLCEEVI